MEEEKTVAEVLFEGWEKVRPWLMKDEGELRARLARRRSSQLLRPPRAWCVAVRASDRRITAWDSILIPDDALDVNSREHLGRVVAHTVTIDRELTKRLCEPVDLSTWKGNELSGVAKRLGRTPDSFRQIRKMPRYEVSTIKGWAGRRVEVPFLYCERLRDPCAGNGFEPPDAVWGRMWQHMGSMVAEGFSQAVWREPKYMKYREEGKRFRGWRWVCPGCGERVRTIFYPVKVPTITEWLGEEGAKDETEEPNWAANLLDVDGVAGAVGTFACVKCHRVRYWTSVGRMGWNQLVGYLSGGLLYGSEVERPGWVKAERKRKYVPHACEAKRGAEVEKLLLSGKKYAEVAVEMGVTISTVQGHVKRLYRRRGVHARGELVRGEIGAVGGTGR